MTLTATEESNRFNVLQMKQKRIEELEAENVTLRADIANRDAAIEWAIDLAKRSRSNLDVGGYRNALDSIANLRARAFPAPEMEEVEIVMYHCEGCGSTISDMAANKSTKCNCYHGNEFIKLKGKRLIPRPRTVTRREPVYFNTSLQHYCLIHDNGSTVKLKDVCGEAGCQIIAEWQEVVR